MSRIVAHQRNSGGVTDVMLRCGATACGQFRHVCPRVRQRQLPGTTRVAFSRCSPRVRPRDLMAAEEDCVFKHVLGPLGPHQRKRRQVAVILEIDTTGCTPKCLPVILNVYFFLRKHVDSSTVFLQTG